MCCRFETQNNILSGITLGPWLRLLSERYADIEWSSYWFRVLFLTFMACLNSCLAFIEYVWKPL